MVTPTTERQLGPLRADLAARIKRGALAAAPVAVVGEAGIGKTWLARACCQSLANEQWVVRQIHGNSLGHRIPLLALTSVMANLTIKGTNPAQLVPTIVQRLIAESAREDGKTLLLVDDAHLLDDASGLVVGALARTGSYSMILTVRSGEVMPAWLGTVMADDATTLVAVPNLTGDEVNDLAETLLGNPLDFGSAHALIKRTLGVPMLVREVLHSLDVNDQIEIVEGRLRLGLVRHGDAALSEPGLIQLVENRLGAVDAELRPMLDLLAVASYLTANDIEALRLGDRVGALLAAELVEWASAGLAFVHPLYGDVVYGGLGVLRRRETCRQLVECLDDGTAHGEEAVRLAAWYLEAGVPIPVALAHHALDVSVMGMQRTLSLQIAQAGFRAAPSADFALKTALLYTLLGKRDDECLRWLDRAEQLVTTSDEAVRVQLMRMATLFWTFGDLDAAQDVLACFSEQHSEDGQADLLIVLAAAFDHSCGRPRNAMIRFSELKAPEEPMTALAAEIVLGMTEVALGNPLRGIEIATTGAEAVAMSGMELELRTFGAHPVTLVEGLYYSGQLDQAHDLAGELHRAAVELREPFVQCIASLLNGRIAILSGRPRTAKRWFSEAHHHADGLDGHPPLSRAALSGLAFAESALGNLSAAGAAVEAATAIDTPIRPFHSEFVRAASRIAYANHGLDAATELLEKRAEREEHCQNRIVAAELLRELVLLGWHGNAAERLEALAGSADSPLIALFARHARCVADESVTGLETIATELQDMGAHLLAAETLIAASQLARDVLGWQRADRLASRSRELLSMCEGAVSLQITLRGLTNRERQVAQLAADGQATSEIATSLGISSRTVSNHLQRAFDKLGVSSRHDLPVALTLGPSIR